MTMKTFNVGKEYMVDLYEIGATKVVVEEVLGGVIFYANKEIGIENSCDQSMFEDMLVR